jgi:hypothetical protein
MRVVASLALHATKMGAGGAVCAASVALVACGFSFGSADLGSTDDVVLPRRNTTTGTEDEAGATEETPAETTPPPTTSTDAGTIDATPTGPLKAFVSSTLTTGNIGGLTGADTLCNNAAKAASLPGTYTAWLSTSTVNAIDRIKTNGPWQLVNGTEIAATRGDLTKGTLSKRFDKDEKGNTPPPEEDRVWTATGPNGTFTAGDCNAWGGTGGSGLVGEAEQTNNGWTALTNEACTEVNRVFCLQQ